MIVDGYDFLKENEARNLEKSLIATGNIDLNKLTKWFIEELETFSEEFYRQERSNIKIKILNMVTFIIELSGKNYEDAEKFIDNNKLITENYVNDRGDGKEEGIILFMKKEVITYSGTYDEDGVPKFSIDFIDEKEIKKALGILLFEIIPEENKQNK